MPRVTRGCAAVVSLMLTFAAVSLTVAASPADLEGDWVLNEELSDDLMAIFQEALDRQPFRLGTVRDDPGNPPGVGGVSAGAGGFPQSGAPRMAVDPEVIVERMEAVARGIEKLRINHEEPMFSIRRADGVKRTLRLDGKKQKIETVDGRVSSKAKWKRSDGHLSITTSTDWGQDMAEIWEIDRDTGRLHVRTVLHPVARLPRIVVNRVYDRGGAGRAIEAPDAATVEKVP